MPQVLTRRRTCNAHVQQRVTRRGIMMGRDLAIEGPACQRARESPRWPPVQCDLTSKDTELDSDGGGGGAAADLSS